MSPDGSAAGTLIASATRRARALVVAEAIAWAAAAAAPAFALTRAAGLTLGARVAAIAAAEVIAALGAGLRRRRGVTRAAIVRALEEAQPASRNLIVTADELERGALTASPATRARVLADAAAVVRGVDPRAIASPRRAIAAAALAAAAGTVAATEPMWRPQVERVATVAARRTPPRAAASVASLHVTIVVEPPPYTSLEPTTVTDPAQVQTIEGSELAIAAATSDDRVTIEHDGDAREAARGAEGIFIARVRVLKTGYLLVAAGSAQRMIPVVAVPDALPSVRLTAPGRDLVYAGGNPRIAFDARATDDLGLRSLALHYTKVSGSGENFEFQDGEIPLEVTRTDARDWSGRASRSLAELGLHEGDMLVYRAIAADARPGDGTGSSDAFFIEISKLGVAAGDAFTLPEEETRYALSQQMLIIKTERLQQRRSGLAAGALSEEALNLAVEQRMIRAEFVFMLGGEIQDEDVEAEQSSELQEGRLQNRGQRDLRAATVAMSQAEKALTAANTADALAAERAAVAALQRAFARDRYILRALGVRSQLDASRRLTGNTSSVHDWRRPLPPAPENRRAAVLQDLVRGLADLARNSAPQARDAAVLAAEAMRIDPSSATMRTVATALQSLGDAGSGKSAAASLSAATAAAVAESRRAHADPAVDAAMPAASLSGAFDDALRRRR